MNKLSIKLVVMQILILLILPCYSHADHSSQKDSIIKNKYIVKTKKIKHLLEEESKQGMFNGVALVSTSGHVLVKEAFGYANLEWIIPNSPETHFRLCSASKPFTAILIMQLIESGKLSSNMLLADVLPWYRKDVASKVSIHHLLSHTSGIPFDLSPLLPEILCDERSNIPSVRELVERYHSGDFEFEPGSSFKYSNSNFVILAAVIEELTGKKIEDVLEERIFTPAGMTHSGSDRPGMIVPMRATGYQGQAGNYEQEVFFNMSFTRGAGNIYTTVEDLYRFDQALYDNILLTDSSMSKMFTNYLVDYFGYGWEVIRISDNPKRTKVRHTGDAMSSHALVLRVLEERHLIVLLTNMDGRKLEEMGDEIIAILLSES